MAQENIFSCKNCRLPYDWRRSPSGSLKMTYCSSLCERADLGFTIEALLQCSSQRSLLRQLELEDRELSVAAVA